MATSDSTTPLTKSQRYRLRHHDEILERRRAHRKEHGELLRAQARALRAKDPERHRAYQRQWRAANPDKQPLYSKRWRESHIEDQRQMCRSWQARHPGYRLNWKRANPVAVAAYDQKRRAALYANSDSVTASDIKLQYDSQAGRCWWCSKPVGNDYHVDHRIPLSRGGTNNPENIVISCPHCNLSKGAKLPQEWIGRLL